MWSNEGRNDREFRYRSCSYDSVSAECSNDYFKETAFKGVNDNLYQTVVTSFTKGTSYELTLSQQFINENDHVLIVDDFLANGEAATGAIRLLRKAHATIAGVGILIEKSFQPGRGKLMEQGIDVYSLARISKLGKDLIEFIPEEE